MNGPRRWTLKRAEDRTGTTFLIDGPAIAYGESVEVVEATRLREAEAELARAEAFILEKGYVVPDRSRRSLTEEEQEHAHSLATDEATP